MLHLGASDLSVMINFIDSAHGVYDDHKSCTGAASTMGYGVLASVYAKNNNNTKISTEAELVGVADFLPKVSYLRLFIEAQGLVLKRNVILQDNQSAMLMEANRKFSWSKRSRHLNIRYFYVTDAIKRQ